MRYASTTFWAILLLAPASRATESVASAPSSNELLEIWNQSYPAGDTSTDVSTFQLEAIDRLEPTGAASADVDYSRPNGGSLTPNFDRLMSRYAAQPSGAASAPVAVQVQHLSQPRGGYGSTTWKGGTGIITGDKKKDDKDPPGNPHDDNPTTPTPEPGTLLLMSAAAGVAGLRARRKRTQS